MSTGNRPGKGINTDMGKRASPKNAQPDQKEASNQQNYDTKGQGVDEMDIDGNRKEGELDPKLMEATKKMGIKPPNEVKNDLDWAEIYSHGYWQSSGASSSR